MSTAESKITDSAIIDTVSSAFLTIDDAASTYATKSSLTQTANDVTFKFSESGGYNIVKNGGFKNGLSGWWEAEHQSNGTNMSASVRSDSNEWVLDGTYALVMRSTNNTSGEYRVDSQKFKVKKYTNYTLSYLVAAHRVTEIGHYIRGNEWTILDSMRYCPKTGGENRSDWTRITHTFNTGDNHQISINFIHFITGNDAYSWITDVMINEGEVALPWSPHPSEIYEGSTAIDANGVTIYNGAIAVKNNAGELVMSSDVNGNLIIQSSVTTGGLNNKYGTIKLLDEQSRTVFYGSKDGVKATKINFYKDYVLNEHGVINDAASNTSIGWDGLYQSNNYGLNPGWESVVEIKDGMFSSWNNSTPSSKLRILDGQFLDDIYISGSYLKSTNGYTKLPNGLIMQWGVLNDHIDGLITFPIAFPNSVLHLSGNINNSSDSWGGNLYFQRNSGSSFRAVVLNRPTKTYTVNWIALGY